MKKTTTKSAGKPAAKRTAEPAANPVAPKRATRAKPTREHPVRGPGTALRPPPMRPAEAPAPAVDSAYAVLDEHLQRGRDAARARGSEAPQEREEPIAPARLLLRAMADTWQAWAGLLGPVASRISQEIRGRESAETHAKERAKPERAKPEREVRFDEDDHLWREVRPSFLPDAPTDQPVRRAAAARATMRVGVEVSSRRRFVARVELTRAVSAERLGVEDLQGPEGACLRGFALEPDDEGAMLLRGDVPDAAAAGTYTAKVRERGTRRELGTVTLVIRA